MATSWSVSIFNGELSKTEFFFSSLSSHFSLFSQVGREPIVSPIASSELKLNIKRVRDC